MGNRIQVPGVTGSIRQPGKSAASASATDIQVHSAGQRAAMGIGFAVVGLMAKAAQAQAETRAMNRLAKWEKDTGEEFRQTANADEAFKLMTRKQAEFDSVYNDIVTEEGSGLIPLLNGDYRNNMAKRFPGISVSVQNGLFKMGQEAFSSHFEAEQQAAIQAIQQQASQHEGPWRASEDPGYQAAMNNVTENAAILGVANTKSHLAALAGLQQQLKESAFESDMEHLAAQDGFDEAIRWGSEPGRAAEYDLGVKDTEQLVSTFRTRATTQRAESERALKIRQDSQYEQWWDNHRQGVLSNQDYLENTELPTDLKLKLNKLDADMSQQIIKNSIPVTSLSDGIHIRTLVSEVAAGNKTLNEALAEYSDVVLRVSPSDRDSILDDIFQAAKQSEDEAKRDLLKQNTDLLGERQQLLRASISQSAIGTLTALDPTMEKNLGAQIAEELAIKASNDLSDAFRDRSLITKDALDRKTNELISINKLSPTALGRAVDNLKKRLGASEAERAKAQQRIIDGHVRNHRPDLARQVWDDAMRLGLPMEDFKGTTEPKKPETSKFNALKNAFKD